MSEHSSLRKFLFFVSGLVIVLLLAGLSAWLVIHRRNGSLVSSGETRHYLLYVPKSYDPAQPVPLVITFHGFASWPAHQARISGWNDLADEQGFVVVYPMGRKFPLRWNANSTPEAAAEEVLFAAELIEKLKSQYNIDPQRIYVNGFSNGGGMSDVLACELSDRIAAVGTVSGAYLYPRAACTPQRPMPMMTFHGTEDPVVPYLGGNSGPFEEQTFPLIADWVSWWAEENACTGEQPAAVSAQAAQGGVSGVAYTGCAADVEVIFYSIAGAGHSWSGGKPMPRWVVGETTDAIDTTAELWAFFQRHPLPAD